MASKVPPVLLVNTNILSDRCIYTEGAVLLGVLSNISQVEHTQSARGPKEASGALELPGCHCPLSFVNSQARSIETMPTTTPKLPPPQRMLKNPTHPMMKNKPPSIPRNLQKSPPIVSSSSDIQALARTISRQVSTVSRGYPRETPRVIQAWWMIGYTPRGAVIIQRLLVTLAPARASSSFR